MDPGNIFNTIFYIFLEKPIILPVRWLSSSKKDFPKSSKLKRKFSDWFSTFTYFMESRLVVWEIFSNSLFIEYLHTRMDYSQGKHLWRKTFIKYAPKIFVCSIISDKNLTVYIKSFSTNQHIQLNRENIELNFQSGWTWTSLEHWV